MSALDDVIRGRGPVNYPLMLKYVLRCARRGACVCPVTPMGTVRVVDFALRHGLVKHSRGALLRTFKLHLTREGVRELALLEREW